LAKFHQNKKNIDGRSTIGGKGSVEKVQVLKRGAWGAVFFLGGFNFIT
jgi:hypothetical protein